MLENKFNPNRLTLARKLAGLKKSDLASELDVDLRTITAYEAGEYTPSPAVFVELQALLGQEEGFFFGPDLEEPNPTAVSFRAMSKLKATQRDMAIAAGALALHFNAWMESKFDLPKADVPDLSREPSPEIAADSLRRYWNIGELPIGNMIHLLESKGVRVFSLAVEARELDACSTWKGQTPFVFLNNQKSCEHSRFDAAHELGHLALHHHGSPNGRQAEIEANAFASAFLMPRSSVFGYARPFPTLASVIQLKRTWTTSAIALTHRLHEVGIITDWHYRSLCIQISQRGYRTTEPNGARHESSQLLAKVLHVLQEDGINRSKLAAILGISRVQLEQLMFGLVMTVVDGGAVNQSGTKSHPQLELVKRI